MESNDGVSGQELERELFLLRKLIEKEKILRFAAAGAEPSDFYICTLSGKTIVYKARRCFRQLQYSGPQHFAPTPFTLTTAVLCYLQAGALIQNSF